MERFAVARDAGKRDASPHPYCRKHGAKGSPAWLRAATLLLPVLFAAPAIAVEPDEVLPDRAMEARARDITTELRCLVCQNQSLDDSHAPLARDLRLLVRERLRTGDTDDEVRRFLVARYGDFVLLRPPVNASTALLWGLPFAVLAVGGVFALWPRRRATLPAGLSQEEDAALRRLLDNTPS